MEPVIEQDPPIRNFCIVAHIDHGKSTLADRLLERGGQLSRKDKKLDQVLDSMDLERERGITIKAKAVQLRMNVPGKGEFEFNLIDTPGHVDFHSEVRRGLSACEGAILLVDATQGVQAQTAANAYLALERGLPLVPVINKIDMVTARSDEVCEELAQFLGIDSKEILRVSAKTGEGVDELIEALVDQIPPPIGAMGEPLRVFVFDASYDSFRGVIVFVRIMDGQLKAKDTIQFLGQKGEFLVEQVGIFSPDPVEVKELSRGSVGWFTARIRDIAQVPVGGTLTKPGQSVESVPGFRPAQAMVTCALFPIDSKKYEVLREALMRMKLSDASLTFKPESSPALSFGFRCGFLGYLHFEIVLERLRREFDLELIATAPSVVYKVILASGETIEVSNPSELPSTQDFVRVDEPYVRARIMSSPDTLAGIIKLSRERRGILQTTETLSADRILMIFEFPLAEVLVDFFDRLKSITRGYASVDYEPLESRPADVVRVDIMLNEEKVDALAFICPRDRAESRGRKMVLKLKELLPQHLFAVPIQAAVGAKVVARETKSAQRKDVTAKCYGGDVSRKRKLLDRQKEGKKKMKSFGKVDVPQEAFLAILKIDA